MRDPPLLQGVKEHLRPLGFTGFMLSELTPNKTRRAQSAPRPKTAIVAPNYRRAAVAAGPRPGARSS